MAENEATEPPHELQSEKAAPSAAAVDLDEGDLADSFDPPGGDLSGAEPLVRVIPVQAGVFFRELVAWPLTGKCLGRVWF
jgi:hypothetical protein